MRFCIWDAANNRPHGIADVGRRQPGPNHFSVVFGPERPGDHPKEICGFGGRSGEYLDAIGFYVRDYYHSLDAPAAGEPKPE
jgi:hypothetical protein